MAQMYGHNPTQSHYYPLHEAPKIAMPVRMRDSDSPNAAALQVLDRCPLFRLFPRPDLERLVAHTIQKQFAAGELVCARGTTGSEFFIVAQGSVQITVPTIDARVLDGAGNDAVEAIVRIVRQGEFFGEIACLEENGLRTANARAAERCVLLVVPREEFLLLVQSRPSAAMGLVSHLAARVRHHTNSMAGLVRPEDYERTEERNRSLWQVVADIGANWSAHWTFTIINVFLWIVWLGRNGRQLLIDLPTINGLTMWVSLQAIIMTTFVLVAQKRAEQKENHRKELQFQWAHATMERLNQVSTRLEGIEDHLNTSSPVNPAGC